MASPRIVIPHGLAADVLRVLEGTRRGTCGAIVDAIDELRGYGDDAPGVGFSPVWHTLTAMARAGVLTRTPGITGTTWAVRRG